MAKNLQTMLLLTIVVALLVAVAGFTTSALALGMSVDPGNQTLSSSNTIASWYFWVADDPGCPENNMKVRVTAGDGAVAKWYNLSACDTYHVTHEFPPVLATFTQKWYAGEGSSPWYYMLSTKVTIQ